MPSCSILLAMSTLNDMETHSVEMPIDSDDVICGIEREKVAATLNLYLADFRMNMRREESDEAKTVLNSIQCPVFFFRLRFSIITSTESDKGFPGIWRTGMPIEKNVGLYFVSLFVCVAYFPGEFSHIAESAFIFLSRTSLLLNITERERISSYVSPLFVWTHLVHFVCCSNSKCRKFQSLAVLANSLTQSTTYFHESSLGNRWNMSLAGR